MDLFELLTKFEHGLSDIATAMKGGGSLRRVNSAVKLP